MSSANVYLVVKVQPAPLDSVLLGTQFSQLPSTKQAGAQVVEHSAAGVDSGCCKSGSSCPPLESVFTLPPRRTVTVRKVYLIVNPFGGKGRGRIVLKAALEEFAKHGATVETLETKHRRHAEEYARTIPLAGFDALCAIGGDGTFNEIVNGMLTREDRQRIPLGFVAGGTGNSTMVDLKCVCAHKCVAAICSGVVRAMDVIEAKFENVDGTPGAPPPFKSFDSPASRYFINALGFGLGVSAATTAEHLRFLWQMRYDVGAFINIIKGFHNPAKLQLDDTCIDSDFAIVVISSGESMTFRFTPGAKVAEFALPHPVCARVFLSLCVCVSVCVFVCVRVDRAALQSRHTKHSGKSLP